jgi:hypothetical protein
MTKIYWTKHVEQQSLMEPEGSPNCFAARGEGAGGAVVGANVIPLERRNQPQAKIAKGTSKRGWTMAKG